jgi:CheY-like chemotaxis protein
MTGEAILIVDDNQANLKLLKVVLTIEGYKVETAQDAEQALVKLPLFNPVLILMDLQMPGIDGYELTRKIKADPTYDRVIIIAVTAYAMKGDKEKAMEAGCNGYITKPVDTQLLPTKIREYLNGEA